MPKRLIKRFLPDHKVIRDHKNLKFLGKLLHDPNLLHLNKKSVSGAFSLGLFVAFIPMPFQMVVAAIGAILFRVNLLISVGLVWVSNPITIPPLFYFAYKVGAVILHIPTQPLAFELSVSWITQKMGIIWEPLLLGCFIIGTLSALVGNLFVRIFWRLHVIRSWKARKHNRLMRVLGSERSITPAKSPKHGNTTM